MSRACAILLVLVFVESVTIGGWKAGVSRASITPTEPMWMSGYASRKHVATGQLTDLWAKALVLEDKSGKRAVVVTLDLVGIDRVTSLALRQAIMTAHDLELADVTICTSHTHSGPVYGTNLLTMYDLDDVQLDQVHKQTQRVHDTVLQIVAEAHASRKAAELTWAVGQCTFAVNRRENRAADVPTLREQGQLKGPVDHEVPVLAVTWEDGQRAIVFGYACHATTLSGYDWCGDWPGYAQSAIEAAHPETTALFIAGCGADQNPLPRKTVELAKAYGQQIADSVGAALDGDRQPVADKLETRYEEIGLAFAHIPTRDELTETLSSTNRYEVWRAEQLLSMEGPIPPTSPYPVQTWRLGDVTWVILGGEVVVDYSLAIKLLNETPVDFVAGYANDVMAYIPSERVLKEGGYEGGGAMVYYGLPSPWATGVEQRIMDAVRGQLQSLAP